MRSHVGGGFSYVNFLNMLVSKVRKISVTPGRHRQCCPGPEKNRRSKISLTRLRGSTWKLFGRESSGLGGLSVESHDTSIIRFFTDKAELFRPLINNKQGRIGCMKRMPPKRVRSARVKNPRLNVPSCGYHLELERLFFDRSRASRRFWGFLDKDMSGRARLGHVFLCHSSILILFFGSLPDQNALSRRSRRVVRLKFCLFRHYNNHA